MGRVARFLLLLTTGLALLAVVAYAVLTGTTSRWFVQQASDALAAALRMPPAEQRDRMRSMRQLVAQFNVYRWAGRMLVDAAGLRRRERLFGRLATAGGAPR
jgi:hypothetical protein